MAASNSSSEQQPPPSSKCHYQYHEWMKHQEETHQELLQALDVNNKSHQLQGQDKVEEERKLVELVNKSIIEFQDYVNQRTQLAKNDVWEFFNPAWCSKWENSLLWIAGCRPSMFIRLVYTMTGLELESKLNEFLKGKKTRDELGLGLGLGLGHGDVSNTQMERLNDLQMKTIKEEEKLTNQLRRLQTEMIDPTVVIMEKGCGNYRKEEAERIVDKYGEEMGKVMEEADKLRIETVKVITEILNPMQAVIFLTDSKKLHLCMHEWGKQNDLKLW